MKFAQAVILLVLFVSITSWGQSFIEIRKDIDQYRVYSSIEEALTTPKEVYRLNLNNSNLDEKLLRESLQQFQNLRELVLSNTFISEIPSSIGALKSLQFLEVEHLEKQNLNLFKIPKSIQKLENIISISLIGNPNLDWHKTFLHLSKIPKLVNIALMYNNYKKLPKSITGLSSLEMIWLGKNPNLDLKDTFSKLSKLDNLGQMGLGGNDQTQLPNEVTLLKNIYNLWLSGNKWENLNALQYLPKLSQLSLNSCNLSQIPNGIIQFKNLEYLSFVKNPNMNFDKVLKSIPSSVKVLNLSDNNINKLSTNSFRVTNLEKLILSNNSISKRALKKYQQVNKNLEIVF
nr:hypothetical protein [uncultured Allomuricauda sp.]